MMLGKNKKAFAIFTITCLLLGMACMPVYAAPSLQIVSINDIPDIKIGHAQDDVAGTGVTVVIYDKEGGATAGVDVRGGSPGTRETDLLDARNAVQTANAIVLSGGSAFGLDAAGGVMKFLEEKNIGYNVGVTVVPIVPQAILFDLGYGDFSVRPDGDMAYLACENAFNGVEWSNGNTGAGTGATVGKITGKANSMKGGLGSYCYKIGDLYVGAIVAVNAVGDVVDPDNGQILAGALKQDKSFLNAEKYIMSPAYDAPEISPKENTTIGIIVTNAKLTQAEANKLASMAHDGFARSIKPSHMMGDGDTIFSMATGEVDAEINQIQTLAVQAMSRAVANSVTSAETALDEVPGHKTMFNK